MIPHAQRYTSSIRQANWVALTTLLFLSSPAVASESWSVLLDPDNSLSFNFLFDDRQVFQTGLGGWGPKWAWVGIQSRQKAENGRLSLRVPFVVNKDKGEAIDVHFEAWQPGARQIALPRSGVGTRRASHHADRWFQFRGERQSGNALAHARREQADDDATSHTRHPFRSGRV